MSTPVQSEKEIAVAEKNKPAQTALLNVTTSISSGTSIKIRWIRIIKDGSANRLLFAGTPSGSSSLTGGYFDTDHAQFSAWFGLLLDSFNSSDASPVYVTFTSNLTYRRNYTYYEQISWPAYTPPEFPAFTSLNLPLTDSLS